jgi:hypothetical protein
MTKKIKKTVPNYFIKDLVVVKTVGLDDTDVKYEIGIITNKRYATQLTTTSYDIRTEAGSALICIGVDDPDSTQTIMSSITNAWIADGGTNNMWIDKKNGHTRANYAPSVELRYDGQSHQLSIAELEQRKIKTGMSPLMVGQFEKHNDFVFPTQGPRSF